MSTTPNTYASELATDAKADTEDTTTQQIPSSGSGSIPTVVVHDAAYPASDPTVSNGVEGSPVLEPAPPDERLSLVQPGRSIPDEELPPPLGGSFALEPRRVDGGNNADVFRAVWTKPDGSTMVVAVKFMRQKGGVDKERYLNRIRREMVIWQAAEHPNVLAFLGYTLDERRVPALVSPWCTNSNLSRYIAIKRPDDVEKIRLLIGAARGLAHLHSNVPPICHADVKPDNVVILENLEAALCDFGVSRGLVAYGKYSVKTTTGSKVGGSIGYQAKEILDGTGTSSPKGDVYAFGGLILATMSGCGPFHLKKERSRKDYLNHQRGGTSTSRSP